MVYWWGFSICLLLCQYSSVSVVSVKIGTGGKQYLSYIASSLAEKLTRAFQFKDTGRWNHSNREKPLWIMRQLQMVVHNGTIITCFSKKTFQKFHWPILITSLILFCLSRNEKTTIKPYLTTAITTRTLKNSEKSMSVNLVISNKMSRNMNSLVPKRQDLILNLICRQIIMTR